MAKGQRSSRLLANRNRLRASLYEPAERARLERLSAKQQALAAQPGPADAVKIVPLAAGSAMADVGEPDPADEAAIHDAENAMQVDEDARPGRTVAQRREARAARRRAGKSTKRSAVFKIRKRPGAGFGAATGGTTGGRRRRP